MVFNGESNNDDLYSEARNWAGIADTDTTTYPTDEFARDANRGLDEAVINIFRADGKWEWDDTNETDLPIVTATLTAGQFDYSIPVTHLKSHKVRIRTEVGAWKTLRTTNRRNLTDVRANAENGEPVFFDKIGNSFMLDPTPNYTKTAGFEVQFQRGPSYFVPGDTTKTPGFASIFHVLVAWYAAKSYCLRNGFDKRAKNLDVMILKMEFAIERHYAKRDANQKISLKVVKDDYGQIALGRAGDGYTSHPDRFLFPK